MIVERERERERERDVQIENGVGGVFSYLKLKVNSCVLDNREFTKRDVRWEDDSRRSGH